MLKGVILYLKKIKKEDTGTTFVSDSSYPFLNEFLLIVTQSGIPVHLVTPAEHFSFECITSVTERFRTLPQDCLLITDCDSVADMAHSYRIPCLGYLPPETESDRLFAAYSLFESFSSIDMAYLWRVHAHACSYPAPILTTSRLIIKEFASEDFAALYEMCAATDESSYLKHPIESYELELQKHEAYIKNVYPFFDLAIWGIYEKQSGKLIGHAGYSLTDDTDVPFAIGYFIAAPYRGQGYASECIPSLLAYAKEQGYSVISAKITHKNIASQKVIKGCGYPYDMLPNADSSTLSYLIHLSD